MLERDRLDLRQVLTGLEFLHAAELEREIHDGHGHTGSGNVVQVTVHRPA